MSETEKEDLSDLANTFKAMAEGKVNFTLGETKKQKGKCAASNKVFSWPEYIALARRLGIDTAAPTRRLILTLEMDSEVQIDHYYLGTDEADG